MQRTASVAELPFGRSADHPQLLTREAFLALVPPDAVCLAEPVDVVRCECRDVNCHGWKFITRTDARVPAPAAGEFHYERELEPA